MSKKRNLRQFPVSRRELKRTKRFSSRIVCLMLLEFTLVSGEEVAAAVGSAMANKRTKTAKSFMVEKSNLKAVICRKGGLDWIGHDGACGVMGRILFVRCNGSKLTQYDE